MATSSELKKLLAAYKANLAATKKNAANALKKSLALYDQDYANTQTSLANALNSDITTMNQNNDANMLQRGIARSDIASNTANKNEGTLRTANAEQLAAALLARNTNRANAQSAYDTAVADAQNTFNDNQLSYLNLLSQMNSGSGGGGGRNRGGGTQPTTPNTSPYSTNPYVLASQRKQDAKKLKEQQKYWIDKSQHYLNYG